MKNLRHKFFGLAVLTACTINMLAYAQQANTSQAPGQNPAFATNNSALSITKFGIVNTKKCLEESKLGKQEQANFDKMKNQIEDILKEKEKVLEDIETKLNDDDYMDSISDEAASELNRKKRNIRNEGMQLQNQYMQTLQQANIKIVQKLTDVISRASDQVRQDPANNVYVIFTDEACTSYDPALDLSDRVIVKMNAIFDAEQKDNSANKTR